MGGRKNKYGYSEYRGRGGGRARMVLLFIIALLAVLLAAGTAFYAMVDLEYSENGVLIHWPWAPKESAPLPPIFSDPIQVDTPPVEVTVEPSLPPEPTPTPPPAYEVIGAVTVTPAQLRSGGAAQMAASAGGTALVVEMKDMNGRLAWPSQAALALQLGTGAADDRTAQAVRELAENTELYLVARVQCFRDPILARNWVGSLMTRGGNVWHDYQGLGWTSPASQQAVDYLSALCLELAEMGFDEIVLDSAGYPNSGEVNVLAVSDNRPADLTVPVSAFLERLSGELAQRDVRLSVATDETLLPGAAVLSGLTAGVLADHADRVWLGGKADSQQYTALLTAAGWTDPAPRLVVKDAVTGAGSWYK